MWLLPTYNRIPQLTRLIDQMKRTGLSTPGRILVNEYDYHVHQSIYDEIEQALPNYWYLRVTAAESLGETVEHGLTGIVSAHKWVGLISDDAMPLSDEWDQTLVSYLTPRTHLVSANDNWQAPQRVGCCQVYSRQAIETLGWLFPPGFKHMYQDDVWETIGRATGIWQVAMDVVVEHWHFSNHNLAEFDDTYKRVNQPERWANYTKRWQEFQAHELDEAIGKINRMIKGEVDGPKPH